MMLRWISLVPPGIVAPNERRYCDRPAAFAPQSAGRRRSTSSASGPSGFGAEEQRLLQRLAAEQLQQRVLGRRLAVQELREAAIAHREQRLRVDVEAGDRVAETSVVAEAAAVGSRAIAERDERVDGALHVVGVGDPQHRPFVRERALRDRPATVQRPDEVRLRDPHVGEEHLVEVAEVGVAQLRERPALDARRGRVDDQRRDALVLGRVRVGAHEAEAPVGVVRAGGPHLLAVHDELVADQLGAGSQAREVAPGVRFAHAEAPRDLGAQGREEEALLLLVGAVVVDRRRDDAETLRVRAARRSRARSSPRSRSSVRSALALRPPSSGGQPGTSQPLSNSFRCQSRAHSGMCALDCFGSRRSSSVGPFASSQSMSSARNRSSSGAYCRRIAAEASFRPPWTSTSRPTKSCCATRCVATSPSAHRSRRTCATGTRMIASRPSRTTFGSAWPSSASSACWCPRNTAVPVAGWSMPRSCSRSSAGPCARCPTRRPPSARSRWPWPWARKPSTRRCFPALADGSTIGTLALYEDGRRYAWSEPATTASVAADG